MANYSEMYKVLFRAITQVVETLQEAQQQTEEMYITDEKPIITILPLNGGDESNDNV